MMLDVNRASGGEDRDAVAEPSVHDSATFGTLIRREKLRADRDGDGFSLVVIDLDRLEIVSSDRRAFAHVLLSNLRSIDTVGWLDERRIGVVLPSTSDEGACQLVDRIIGERGFTPHCLPYEIYAYPCQELPLGSGESAAFVGGEGGAPAATSLPEVFCIAMPFWKRALDIIGSGMALLLVSPLLLAVAGYIKIVSPGPALFKQLRVGYRGKLFTFIKFRTMHPGNHEELHKKHIVARLRFNEPLEKLDDKGDPRIIRGGRALRRACVDELPQLFNVLRGEMSLVGPRPCLPYEAAELLRWHGQRFDVVPGMTGLWQISGKNKLCLLEMIRLDISYATNMSFWLDLKILFLTFPEILRMVTESIIRKVRSRRSAS